MRGSFAGYLIRWALLFGVAAPLLTTGCSEAGRSPAQATPTPAQPSQSSPKNGAYEIEGRLVEMTDGVSVTEAAPGAASKITTRYFGNDVTGDFDGDGTPDVAFVLSQNAGGSGTFFYVAAALRTKDGYRGTNAVLLGDRIAPQTTEFRGGRIVVNVAQRKPGEPMVATPSVGVSKYLKLVNKQAG